MSEQPSAPIVKVDGIYEIARGLFVIPDLGVPLVPNIGVIVGNEAVLVVDTGMGPRNATNVLTRVNEIAAGKKIYLTTTHFHPEHSFGASVFAEHATVLVNRDQNLDLLNKGEGYLDFFRSFGDSVSRELESVELIVPEKVYDDYFSLDLGGRTVEMQAVGRAHTRGDQVIRVPELGAIFCGDLVEESQFSIFPWFPPEDVDVSGVRWLNVIDRLINFQDKLVVPGHGRVGDGDLLREVYKYLNFLKREVWTRKGSGMDDEQIQVEIEAEALALHPSWVGREWIEKGVQCLCSEFVPN
jgi:glyoxylase-like metal-dependent hydrolase (beta-lactamase superfamily II)